MSSNNVDKSFKRRKRHNFRKKRAKKWFEGQKKYEVAFKFYEEQAERRSNRK